MGKNQKPPAIEGNKQNRKALGDIGNTVNAGAVAQVKPPPLFSRPMTRGYQEQLRKAQLAVKKATQPQPEPAGGGGVGGNGDAKGMSIVEATMPGGNGDGDAKGMSIVKATMPGGNGDGDAKGMSIVEATMPGDADDGSSCRRISSRRKPNARNQVEQICLSFRFSSRSRVFPQFLLILGRRKQTAFFSSEGKATMSIHDQLVMVEYVEDLYAFYRDVELECRPSSNYMISQPELSPAMRSILVDWVVEVHQKFELLPETLYLSVYIIDRYLSSKTVRRKEFQLVGAAAMLIACKHEEIWPPEVKDFIFVSNRAFGRPQILAMEKDILEVLNWNITVPTAYIFVLRFLKIATARASSPAPAPVDKELAEHVACFLTELGLMKYSILAHGSSMLAASAVYVARCMLTLVPHWNKILKRHTCFKVSMLRKCASILVDAHSETAVSKLRAVFRKYSSSRYTAVALKPPADKKAFDDDNDDDNDDDGDDDGDDDDDDDDDNDDGGGGGLPNREILFLSPKR